MKKLLIGIIISLSVTFLYGQNFAKFKYQKYTIKEHQNKTVNTQIKGSPVDTTKNWIEGTAVVVDTSDSVRGDLKGTVLNPTVIGLRGYLIDSIQPSIGQVLQWNGSSWTPANPTGDITAVYAGVGLSGGGTQGDITLSFDQAWGDSRYVLQNSGVGGDLSGSILNPTVVGLRGRPISSTPPSPGQVLKWNGSQWEPSTDQTGGGGELWHLDNSWLTPTSSSYHVGIGVTSNPGFNEMLYVEGGSYISGGLTVASNSNGSSDGIHAIGGDQSGGKGVLAYGYQGVHGWAATSSGYGVYSEGNFAATGTKSAIVRTNDGPRKMYTIEAPEVWFEDFGISELKDGYAKVELDPKFLQVVTIDHDHPLLVFITLMGPASGFYVKTNDTGFEVFSSNNEKINVKFMYRVVAKRKGYENVRMEPAEIGYLDHYVYPDDNDPDIPPRFKALRAERERRFKKYRQY